MSSIAIIGGGIVGMTLAVSLKNTDLQVILVDSSPVNVSEDTRLIALNESSVSLFERIGCWPELQCYAAPIDQIHVSHRGHFGITRIHCQELKVRALGYVIPAKHIYSVLNAALVKNHPIQWLRPAKLTALDESNQDITIHVAGDGFDKKLNVNYVIGADGCFSTVRHLLKLTADTIDYQQSALVTTTTLQRRHHNIAYERFQEDGAIAMLPLLHNQAATIWTAPNERIHSLMHLPEAIFLNELQTCFGYRLGRLLNIEKRSVYPLQMLYVKNPVRKNIMLIGNAAHTLHPIAAQGLNLAFSEIACLTKYFHDKQENSCFEEMSLPSSRVRFSKNLSHHLTWLFSSNHFLLNAARQAGMIGLDICAPIKKRFALQAMGKSV